ncbi:beta-lactamase/transpeptidase-like protein [Cadophora sp. DSE1049]|nr:beta-lactamase/transpeptidase-like protein [Cadophora sp. DSE1049]
MDDLSTRLTVLKPKIEKLMSIGGTPGLSLGVQHEGQPLYFANFGYRDVASKLPPTEETIYLGCSLTEALVAAAAGTLVDEGKLAWDTQVIDVVPDFNISDDTIRLQVTIEDLLAHRAGFTPFRAHWQYNNLGYELASVVIDKAYTTLDDGSPIEIPTVQSTDKIFSGAAGGLRTCVKDLLTLYSAFIHAANDQFDTGKTSTPGSPIKQASHLMSSKIPMGGPTKNEASYAVGWARVQLPGAMGGVGCNPPLIPDGMPIVGRGVPSKLVIYHQGSLPGALATVNLIPETKTSIVVLSNSLALNNVADWVGQKNDYIKAATSSVKKSLKWYSTVTAELEQEQKQNASSKELDHYTGTYWNKSKTMKLEVTVEMKDLYYSVQGLESEKYILKHYEDDTFTWIRPRNELIARGRWVDQGPAFWKIRFGADSHGNIDRVAWTYDLEVPEGETFYKIS